MLADAILLLGINIGLLYTLGFFRKVDNERVIDETHNSDADLFLQRFLGNASTRVGGTIVVALLFIAYVMPRVDPYSGATVLRDGDLSRRLDPPDCVIGWLRLTQGVDSWTGEGDPPSSFFEFPCEHPFGFDKNGRDMARRVLHGISVSLAVSLIAVSISLFIGASVGLTAGYLGGWLDALLMRTMDIMLAFPSLLLAIAIVAMRGPGLENGMIAIGIVGIPVYARLARSMAITVRRQEYVTAALSIGASHWRILRQHVLPNSLAPLIVQSTLGLGTAVIETAALGFLGLGQQPPYPELGKMLAESREVMTSGKWWVMLFPGITVMLIVLGFNLLGDALRDTLDPQLRGQQ
ncbi:MAG: ABC transporter permease [Anaerolineae bacterium]|nr:ABC transporter permease [Anaerolineae bacterium]